MSNGSCTLACGQFRGLAPGFGQRSAVRTHVTDGHAIGAGRPDRRHQYATVAPLGDSLTWDQGTEMARHGSITIAVRSRWSRAGRRVMLRRGVVPLVDHPQSGLVLAPTIVDMHRWNRRRPGASVRS